MPAGLTRAGTSLAGVESLARSAAVGIAAPYLAVLFDPKTRQFNPAISVHPVDQAVAIALGIALGSCTSAPKIGLRKPLLRNATGQAGASNPPGGASLQRRSYDAVTAALSTMLANKDVLLVGVEPQQDPSVPGRLILAVTYKNLRLTSLSSPLGNSQTVLTNPPGG